MNLATHFNKKVPVEDLLIQQATATDIEPLAELFDNYRQFYGKVSDLNSARDFLLARLNNKESVIFIAYLFDKAVGFTQLYPSFSSVSLSRTFILNDLFVMPEARRNSVAKYLLHSAKSYAKSVGAIKLTLSTATTNENAQRLYVAEGWQPDEGFLVYELAI